MARVLLAREKLLPRVGDLPPSWAKSMPTERIESSPLSDPRSVGSVRSMACTTALGPAFPTGHLGLLSRWSRTLSSFPTSHLCSHPLGIPKASSRALPPPVPFCLKSLDQSDGGYSKIRQTPALKEPKRLLSRETTDHAIYRKIKQVGVSMKSKGGIREGLKVQG